MPGVLLVLTLLRHLAGLEVIPVDDLHDLAGVARLLEPLECCLGQNLGGVLVGAGRAHEPTLRDSELQVVVRIPHVELGVAHVLLGNPTSNVFPHGELRIPVAEVEHVKAVVSLPDHADARGRGSTRTGHPELPIQGERAFLTGCDALGQSPNMHHRAGHAVRAPAEILAVELHLADRHSAGDLDVPVAERSRLVEVLPQVHLEVGHGPGRPVDVGHLDVTLDNRLLRDQLRPDLVARVVGPVLRTRRTVVRPRPTGDRVLPLCPLRDRIRDGPLDLRENATRAKQDNWGKCEGRREVHDDSCSQGLGEDHACASAFGGCQQKTRYLRKSGRSGSPVRSRIAHISARIFATTSVNRGSAARLFSAFGSFSKS